MRSKYIKKKYIGISSFEFVTINRNYYLCNDLYSVFCNIVIILNCQLI